MEKLKDNAVFVIAFFVILVFVIPGIVVPERFYEFADFLDQSITETFGWAYLISAFLFLIFCIYLAFSKYGNIKLGKPQDKPQFTYFGWFSMLFAAGMGIGIMFWGVAEPMSHYLNPPDHVDEESAEAAEFAMQYSFFHWSIHPWAIYITMSLCIAYFSFRRDMPPLISSCFYPLIGERIYSTPGYIIDVLAIFATVFGIVTSLGLGALQITSGIGEVFGVETSYGLKLLIIGVVTVMFLASTLYGVDRGIQIISKTNIIFVFVLLAAVIIVGPTVYILNVMTQSISDFTTNFVSMSLSTNPFRGYEWTQSWTFFYWAWWISWSPFVGLFVASISRGRSISEFISGALIVPALLTFLWFSAFGGTGFDIELNQASGFADKVADEVEVGLYYMFEHLPATILFNILTLMLLIVFFVTSGASATHVLSMMSTGGNMYPPAYKKVTWGVIISVVASVLLYAGGLEALQKMAITAALPFTIIMLLMIVSLMRGLDYEYRKELQDSEK